MFIFLYFFSKRVNAIWLPNMEPVILLSPFFLLHLPFVIPSLFFFFLCFCPASLFSVLGPESDPRPSGESSLYLSSIFSFAVCFVSISVSIAGDKTAAVWSDRRHQFALLPTLSGFSPFPSEASPSIFLFFLNVIVKCSSEMTLNMCTLTEGIHLVIYFLIPVSRCLSVVSLSFYPLRLYAVKLRSAGL